MSQDNESQVNFETESKTDSKKGAIESTFKASRGMF